jgi:hypothetical protein
MDELRQQTADAENAHLTVVKSAEIEVDQLRRALSRKDEGATRQFDEMRSELGAEARKVISDRDQQIQSLNEKLVAIQRAAIERDDKRVLESQAQVAELAQKLEIATSQAALREQRLASEWKASMQRMQEELANRDKATQFAIATTMKSQTEGNEKLLASHMTSAQALMEGFHTIIGQSLVERDARIEMLTASQKAQADAAAASAAAQQQFMQIVVEKMSEITTTRVVQGGGGEDPPPGRSFTSLGYGSSHDRSSRARSPPLTRGSRPPRVRSPDQDPDPGDDDDDDKEDPQDGDDYDKDEYYTDDDFF